MAEKITHIKPINFEAPNSVGIDTENKPAAVDAGAKQTALNANLVTGKGAPWWHSQFNLMLCVFALLAVLALLIIQLTPVPQNQLDPDAQEGLAPNNTNNETVNTANSVVNEDNGASPWTNAQITQARLDSQTVLADLLASKKRLEQRKVTNWAQEAYQQGLTKAALGDQAYKDQKFPDAMAAYNASLNQMLSIEAQIPSIVSNHLQQGQLALDQGKAVLAKSHFSQALELDSTNADASSGLQRASILDQVLALVSKAKQYEDAFDDGQDIEQLISAQTAYKQAQQLDPLLSVGRESLQRVQLGLNEKRFKIAMSEGFNALFSGRNTRAKKAFSNALSLKPNDVSANSAYKQSLASDKRTSLASVMTNAKKDESKEDWPNALLNYQQVLERDPNQLDAKIGVLRTKARSRLDARIRSALKDPTLLSNSINKEQAKQTLLDAKAIKHKGARLLAQIDQLETALAESQVSIKVQLNSDANTALSLRKVGAKKIDLGKFNNKNLLLKPGRYILTGVRSGYQDVRLEINLTAGSKDGLQVFTLRCENQINASRNKPR